LSIGADDPAAGHGIPIHSDTGTADSADARTPEERYAGCGSALDHGLMQNRAAHSAAGSGRERSIDGGPGSKETDTAKRERILGGDGNTEPAQNGQRVRHQAFPTRLFDGRQRTIGDQDAETFVAGCYGRSQSGRAAAHDDNIGSV
jgi:hypothetical protein